MSIFSWFKRKPKPWLSRDAKGQLLTAKDIKTTEVHGTLTAKDIKTTEVHGTLARGYSSGKRHNNLNAIGYTEL